MTALFLRAGRGRGRHTVSRHAGVRGDRAVYARND